MNIMKKIIVATALTGVLAMANLGAVQAGDSSPGSKPMKPLYAVSFDVGRKHVLSYFLSKNGLCDLTLMVTDLPDELVEGGRLDCGMCSKPLHHRLIQGREVKRRRCERRD